MIPWHHCVNDFELPFLIFTMPGLLCSISVSPVLETGFCISCFPASALDDEGTTSLHILFQISSTEASGPFPLLLCGIFYTDFLLTEGKSKQYVSYSQISLCIA